VDPECSFTDGSNAVLSSGNDTLLLLTKDFELRQKAVEEKYSEQMAELKKAEEDIHLKEEFYRQEDEARLEKLTAQNSFVEKLDVRKVQLMYFIEVQQQSAPAGFDISPSTSLFHSEGHLNEVCDGWLEKMYPTMPRTVSSASGRLLTTSKYRSLKDNATLNGTVCPDSTSFTAKNKQHYSGKLTQTGEIDQKVVPDQRTASESLSDLCLSTELSTPWRLLSDNPDVKSRSASAPHLSDEASASLLSDDETRSILLSRLARSPSPRATQLSSVSLVSVPESIHEEQEESPIYGRLSVSEVDIRRHQFPCSDNRIRRSLDEEDLSGQNTASSIRCLTGSNQDVVITDSGLPSSPEAGHLDSSESCYMNATVKRKAKASKQTGVLKSSGKSEPGILQKISATLTSLTRRQDTKSVSAKKQTPASSLQSHQQSDTGVLCDSRNKSTGKAKIQANATSGIKPAIVQSKYKLKQPLSAVPKRYLRATKGRLLSDAAEKKIKSDTNVQDKLTMPAKMRESFRSFRQRLKLTAGKGQKRKSGDIPVEIFLQKSKVADVSEDSHDLCAVEEQTYNAVANACLSDEALSQHIDWTEEWTDRFGVVTRKGDEKELKTMKGCDDDGQFSDDSLSGQNLTNNSYCQAAELYYGHVTGPVYDGQYFLPYVQESVQPTHLDAISDGGSFSEDSLAEDVVSCCAGAAVKELGQKPTAVLLPCSTRSVSPTSAVPCITHHENNRLMNQDIVESEEQSALCTRDEAVYKPCRQTVILPASDLQIAPVMRDHTALPTGTYVAAHSLDDDSTSPSAAG